MNKNMSWKLTESITFQTSISGAGEFGLSEDPKMFINKGKGKMMKNLLTSQFGF